MVTTRWRLAGRGSMINLKVDQYRDLKSLHQEERGPILCITQLHRSGHAIHTMWTRKSKLDVLGGFVGPAALVLWATLGFVCPAKRPPLCLMRVGNDPSKKHLSKQWKRVNTARIPRQITQLK